MSNSKEKKFFNLALKKQINDKIQKSENGNNLQTIIQIPQNKSSQQILDYGRSKNMFEQQKLYHLKTITIDSNNQYNILCKKQFETYKSRIKKIKNNGVPPLSRLKASESFLSSCRNTGTFVDIPQNNGCLLKEQLQQLYTKLKSKKQQGQEKEQKYKSSQSQRFNNPIPSSIHKKHQKYKNSWEILNNSTERLRKNITNSTFNLWSRGNSLQNHRKKVEQLINYTIKSEKQNIQPISWVENLRNPNPLKLLLKDKYIESVEREGIRLKGQNKLDKQYNWVNEKKINYFETIDNKSKLLNNLTKNNQKQKQKKGLSFILQNLQSKVGNKITTNVHFQ